MKEIVIAVGFDSGSCVLSVNRTDLRNMINDEYEYLQFILTMEKLTGVRLLTPEERKKHL